MCDGSPSAAKERRYDVIVRPKWWVEAAGEDEARAEFIQALIEDPSLIEVHPALVAADRLPDPGYELCASCKLPIITGADERSPSWVCHCPVSAAVSPAEPREAATVLRRLWDELGPKEHRWLPVDLERDVLDVLQLSTPERATSPGKRGDVGVGNEPRSGAELPYVSPADTPDAATSLAESRGLDNETAGSLGVSPADTIRAAEEWIGDFRDTWDWPIEYATRDVDRAAAWTTLDQAATLAEEMAALASELLAVGERDKAEIELMREAIRAPGVANVNALAPRDHVAPEPVSLPPACPPEMTAAMERDRRQIAQLTEALERYEAIPREWSALYPNYHRTANVSEDDARQIAALSSAKVQWRTDWVDAVLAGEEDEANG